MRRLTKEVISTRQKRILAYGIRFQKKIAIEYKITQSDVDILMKMTEFISIIE